MPNRVVVQVLGVVRPSREYPAPSRIGLPRRHLAAWPETSQGHRSAPELAFRVVAGVGFEPT